MDDRKLARLRADLQDKLRLIEQKKAELAEPVRELAELQDEAADLAAQINDEMESRKDFPGTVHPFRPRPGGTPEDDE